MEGDYTNYRHRAALFEQIAPQSNAMTSAPPAC